MSEWQEHNGAVTGSSLRVQYDFSEMAGGSNRSRPVSMTYPTGRIVNYNYDVGLDSEISRLSSIGVGGSVIESYDYLGLGTTVKRGHGGTGLPGVNLSMVKLTSESVGDAGDQYTGLDRFGRLADQRWLRTSNNANVDRYQYTYDRNSNRTAKSNLVDSNFHETYGYDGLEQLTSFNRTGIAKSWDYDAVGNWDGVTTNSVTESRTHNKQNELLTATGQTSPTYDANGNQTRDFAGRLFTYDAWNRTRTAARTRTYEYDGLGRRIEEVVGANTTDFYHTTNWQVVEERVNGVAKQQFVWAAGYVDEMILRYRDADGSSGNGLEERLWAMQDGNYNVTALMNNSGTVLERYAYDPYGQATIYDGNYNVRSSSSYGWSHLHQGLDYDDGTGKHHNRHRDYDAVQGRFTSVDPKGFGAGDVDLYRYVGNGPVNACGLGISWHRFPTCA